MWTLAPYGMCRRHLLGEHVELHMVVGAWEHGRWGSVLGLADKGYLDTSLLAARHELIAEEITRRGWQHHSPLIIPEDLMECGHLDVLQSNRDLLDRCPLCRSRAMQIPPRYAQDNARRVGLYATIYYLPEKSASNLKENQEVLCRI
jgi:hypothetical protein